MVESFLERCLQLDLESRGGDDVFAIGAVLGGQTFARQVPFDLGEALGELDAWAADAEFVLGHNLLDHDLPILARRAPGLGILAKPVVDTLYLSPLAFPENPYHHLVKDYRLVRASRNDPVADARLAARVFADQWQSFERQDGELLAFFSAALGEAGLAEVFRHTGAGAPPAAGPAREFLRRRFAGVACSRALSTLGDDVLRPAWAYAAAWLGVAGGNSVLPPWVRRRWPELGGVLDRLRDIPCGDPGCSYCRSTHDPASQLRRTFGFESFRGLQEAIVRRGLEGRPLLAIQATGAGKSIGFQLPALSRFFRRGVLTVVVSPLQALMKDQVDHFNGATGTDAAAALYGLLTPPERGDVLERVRLGDVALLYVAPEQLRNASFRRVVEQREIGAWVFDEVHCLSKWGHDFRPDYLYASRFIRDLAARQGVGTPPVSGFTATAKEDVKQEVLRHFAEVLHQELAVFEAGVERTELRFRVEAIGPQAKLGRVHELLEDLLAEGSGAAVVYFASRRRTEEAAEFLKKKGMPAEAFHAGLKAPEKRERLADFLAGRLRVVCATNAFGMGIDKDDVRLVIHADVPGSLESYLQEAGRAGRDHHPSDCVLLFHDDDVEHQFKLSAASRLSHRDLVEILAALRRARRRGRDEAVVEVTPGELLRDEDLDLEFAAGDRGADTRVKTAVAWLERSALVERSENRTLVFQGRLLVDDLETAKRRIARLSLSTSMERRWLAIVGALLAAGPDEGMTADEIAQLPDVAWSADPDDPLTPGQKVMRILHSMAEAGLLSSGLRLTAFVTRGGPHASATVFESACALETALLDLLQETEPEADDGAWFEVSVRRLNQALLDQGHERSNPTLLRQILRSLALDGKGLAASRGSLELVWLGRSSQRLRVLRPWAKLRELAALRQRLAKTTLDALLARLPPQGAGSLLVEFGSEELTDAIRRDLTLRSVVRDELAAAERALLFLHEQKAIHLQQGLAVFRQAMTIAIPPESTRKRFTRGDYQPLAEHYGERNFQIHVMEQYAKLGLEAVRDALALVADYFRLGKTRFVERYFAGREEILTRATRQESFQRIVESLGNPDQKRLVAAPASRNLLVLAGPGSGKTRVVVHRCAYLLRVERVPAKSILVLCFNRNAALELRRRLCELAGDDARGVTVLTYHGLAMRLTGTSFAALARNGDERRQPDFSRLIPDAIRLLNDPDGLPGLEADELRERLLAGYRHILVDEYQDVNREQYDLLSAVAGRTEQDRDRRLTILAVGDDDQNIYAFNGANVEFIRRFHDDYGAEVHPLVECYRCSPRILAAANRLIAQNRDRMKTGQPIRVDGARAKGPPGEPVRLIRVADAGSQAAAVAARLRELAPADWNDCAVLARRHEDLVPVRALLEDEGVPIAWTADRDRLPRLTRIREIAALVDRLEAHRHELRAASRLAEWLPERDGNPWWRLVEELIEEWRLESDDAETGVDAALEHVYEALAEKRRDPAFGDGVRLLTVHAAKGLEFRHVLVLDGGWQPPAEAVEEERRLYYVGMTRARETLDLVLRADERNLFASTLLGDVAEVTSRAAPPDAAVLARRFEVLGLQDLFLSWAGRYPATDPVHRRLAALAAGATLTLDASGQLLDRRQEPVAVLSQEARSRWEPRRSAIEAIRVVAMLRRDAESESEPFRSELRTDRWELPLVEVRYSG